MVQYLLEEESSLAISRDIITNFTPLHYAVFVENPVMLELLLSHHPYLDLEDSFGGTPLDYAKMLGIVPCNFPPKPRYLSIYNNIGSSESARIEKWDLRKFEEYLFNLSKDSFDTLDTLMWYLPLTYLLRIPIFMNCYFRGSK